MCCHGAYILVSNRIETSCVTFCVLDCASYCDNVLGRGEREKGEGTDERGKGKRDEGMSGLQGEEESMLSFSIPFAV